MEFRPVRLEDKAAIERFTRPSGICNCDLAFANMYCWEGTYRSAWCVEEGFLLIRFYIDGSHHIGYMQPLGEGDFTHLIPSLEADARAAGQPLRISGLTPEGAAAVRRAHPEFGIWRNRDYEDYVYRADDLRNLTGRRYQPKRNHINRFEAAYDYRYEELTPALAPECMRLEREWRAGHDSHAAELTAEQRAMQRAFDHFGELELRGGALFVGEKLVAFTIGSAINDEAFCIHVEKADTRYDGAFTMINRLFAQHLLPHYTLIDREEDLGLEGLRQSKLSYHPLFLQPKLTAQRLTEEQLQLRALWLACFPEDTQDDVEQFLLSRYDERRCLVARRDGRIAAMLHIVPFRDTAYIYAVATAPDCRQQGLAGGLLREALDRCPRRRVPLRGAHPRQRGAATLVCRLRFRGGLPCALPHARRLRLRHGRPCARLRHGAAAHRRTLRRRDARPERSAAGIIDRAGNNPSRSARTPFVHRAGGPPCASHSR